MLNTQRGHITCGIIAALILNWDSFSVSLSLTILEINSILCNCIYLC
jgi:hypothetical protein